MLCTGMALAKLLQQHQVAADLHITCQFFGCVCIHNQGWCAVQVSTECDAHLSYDTQATIDKVRSSPALCQGTCRGERNLVIRCRDLDMRKYSEIS